MRHVADLREGGVVDPMVELKTISAKEAKMVLGQTLLMEEVLSRSFESAFVGAEEKNDPNSIDG